MRLIQNDLPEFSSAALLSADVSQTLEIYLSPEDSGFYKQ